MTTFVTRETARDALVTLFVTTAKWQSVFGYFPKDSEVEGVSPFLMIESAGTRQDMNALHTNPTMYRFVVTSFVIRNDKASFDESDCEDKMDELDMTFRQTIRDNAGGISGGDYLRFGEGISRTGYLLIGEMYRFEEWEVLAHFVAGS